MQYSRHRYNMYHQIPKGIVSAFCCIFGKYRNSVRGEIPITIINSDLWRVYTAPVVSARLRNHCMVEASEGSTLHALFNAIFHICLEGSG